MQVYFVQHGIAQSKDVDASRPLSSEGRDAVIKVARYLKEHDIKLNKVCHSGKKRAQQTATLFAEILGTDCVEKIHGMEPNDPPFVLQQMVDTDGVMYVGHLPNLQKVVSSIVTGNAEQAVIQFQNAAVVCIEIDQDVGCIKWFVSAELCQ